MWIYLTQLILLHLLDASALENWSPRVFNGDVIDIERTPWQISLYRYGHHACGGTIYSKDIIITAGHCLVNMLPKQMQVRAGSTEWKTGGQFVPVAAFKIHDDFRKIVGFVACNDVGVLRLSRPLELGQSVQAIPLATESPKNGSDAFVSGWGDVKFKDLRLSPKLRGVGVQIIDLESCALSKYSSFHVEFTQEIICAGDQFGDACQSDSGGPLVSNHELVGVISGGYLCGEQGYPGLYANVAYFHDWLVNAAEELMMKDI